MLLWKDGFPCVGRPSSTLYCSSVFPSVRTMFRPGDVVELSVVCGAKDTPSVVNTTDLVVFVNVYS